MPDDSNLSPSQLKALSEIADSYLAGKMVWKLLVIIGGIVLGVLAGAYYLSQIVRGGAP